MGAPGLGAVLGAPTQGMQRTSVASHCYLKESQIECNRPLEKKKSISNNVSISTSCYGREVKATDLNPIQGHLFHFVSVGSNPTGSVFFLFWMASRHASWPYIR